MAIITHTNITFIFNFRDRSRKLCFNFFFLIFAYVLRFRMDRNGKITIIEVAKKAGVSKGTVDRVVHNRGEVSKESADKVRKAIEELDYQPNLYASLLASRKSRVIACLLPRFTKGDFWEKLYLGFIQGSETVSSLNIHTQVFLYDEYDPESFSKVSEEMLETEPSGVVMQPFFKDDSMALVSKLESRSIPFVFVDSKLDGADYLAYYGMPMYKSGRLCAHLLTERLQYGDVDEVAVVRINRDKAKRSDPTLERRAGFTDYMRSHFPDCRIHHVFIDPGDSEGTFKTLDDFFKARPDVKCIVMFNSRIHLLTEYLKANPVEGRRVIGYDDLEKNIEAVKAGYVTLLISEHIEEQAKQAVITLADNILMYKRPVSKDNYMHMDILTRFNLENY